VTELLRYLFDQFTATIGGLLLGMLTFTWLHAAWLWWHSECSHRPKHDFSLARRGQRTNRTTAGSNFAK
jgi:hypothetical protein